MSGKIIVIPPSIISDVINLLTSIIASNNNEILIEVEARFGRFSGVEFTSGVSRGTFNRIKETMKNIDPRFVYVHSKDEIFRDHRSSGWPYDKNTTERYTTVYSSEGLVDQFYWLIKSRVQNFDVPNYFLRIAVSKETTYQSPRPSLQPIRIREKKRWSYEVSKNRFRVDLTEVTTYNPNDRNPRGALTVFEIEIEVLSPQIQNLDAFEDTVSVFLKEIQGTLMLYTSQEKAEIITRTNTYIGASPNQLTSIDLNSLIQPRNLKIRDLSMGAIIPTTNRSPRYTATIKADGKRRLLVIDRLGIYLVYADQVMKIANANTVAKLLTWHGTVFECEYIPQTSLQPDADIKYKQAKVYVAIYDTLCVANQSDIRNNDHLTRLEYAQQFLSNTKMLKSFIFEVKEFLQFKSVHDFYQIVNTVLSATYPFKTDGLIFTPNNYRYDPKVNRMKLRERILKTQPDIMKWKPPSELTIDFAIRHVSFEDGNYIELLVSQGNRLVQFSGKPFDPKTDIHVIPELQNAPNNSVIEFKWTYEDVDSSENTSGKFVYVRPRDDKPYPNKQEVALDVWKDIHSPIDEATIRGQKFSLAFRYHGREKWNLFNMIGSSLPPVNGVDIKFRILLDVGSGRGGDSIKWVENGFTHVICVEPNEENRIELISRLEALNRGRIKQNLSPLQYRIIPTTGQDWQTIVQNVREFSPNGYVDAISFMLSLSFFFDSHESIFSILNLVNNTLARGGYFFALTIDGRYVLEYFDNVSNYIEINYARRSYMQLIDFQLRFPTTEIHLPHVFINIPNSIVRNQIEYLTNLPDLMQSLQNNLQIPLVPVNEWRTDKETFLLPEEIQYTRLFTAFIMKRT